MDVFKDERFNGICGEDIAYGFYGRTGGVSQGIYGSLNCGPGTNDDPENVAQNRNIVAQNLCGKSTQISTLYQCHTADCFSIIEPVPEAEKRPQGDALVTDIPELPIGCLTADCGPVLFAAKKADGKPVIGAAHAGWGGALKGVLENTITAMVQLGAERDTVAACVGPSIQVASYEVTDDFARPFLIQHEEAEHFFKSAAKQGHLMFDLPGYITMRLAKAGVRRVSLMGVDTYADEAKCFSFRRATHRKEKNYGRQISAIVIR